MTKLRLIRVKKAWEASAPVISGKPGFMDCQEPGRKSLPDCALELKRGLDLGKPQVGAIRIIEAS